MNEITFYELAASLLVGLVIIWGIQHRYTTWGTPASNRAIKRTALLFAAVAIGISITHTSAALGLLAHPISQFVFYVLLASCVFAPPYLLYLTAYSYFYFDGQWPTWTKRPGVNVAAASLSFIASPFIIINVSPLIVANAGLPFAVGAACATIIVMMTALGILHGVAGSLVSSANIALFLASFFNSPSLPNISVALDVLSDLGVESHIFGYVIIVFSTLLGIQDVLAKLAQFDVSDLTAP